LPLGPDEADLATAAGAAEAVMLEGKGTSTGSIAAPAGSTAAAAGSTAAVSGD
jgi:hypothetical protein